MAADADSPFAANAFVPASLLGEHRQGDVGIPRSPGPDLVVVQPGLVLGLLEAFLASPTGSGDLGQIGQAGSAGSVPDVVGDLAGVADRAAGQQPVPAPGSPADADREPGSVIESRAVCPVSREMR